MGIKGLSKLIRDVAPQSFSQGTLDLLRESIVAVDASLYLFKFVACSGELWTRSFMTMIIALQRYRIKPIFVFDGEAPVEKEIERARRSDKRDGVRRRIADLKRAIRVVTQQGPPEQAGEALDLLNALFERIAKKNPMYADLKLASVEEASAHLPLFASELERIERQEVVVTEEHMERLQELLEIFGLPYIEAECEGETLASYLAKHGRVSAVFSDDSDVLVYGTPMCVSQVNFVTGECRIVRYGEVLRGLQLTPQQFTDLCIMCGTDYNPNIPRVGPKTAYRLITEHGSLEAVEAAGEVDTHYLNYKRVRELFAVPAVLDVEIPPLQKPRWSEVRSFCADYDCQVNIPAIRKHWEARKLIFE